MTATPGGDQRPGRLAIVGAGSSGLISLKFAREFLPNWHIDCFEKSDHTTGVWGDPYPGFVSTSTKYTTQFSCYPEFDAVVNDDGGASRSEFFRNDEYGQYLTRFAQYFDLDEHVTKNCEVVRVAQRANGSGWVLTRRKTAVNREAADTETAFVEIQDEYDAVILCTGLVAAAKDFASNDLTADRTLTERMLDVRSLLRNGRDDVPRDKSIVVIGGGESAVDFADRLAHEELNNRVFLSLRSGVRVSPRYHPIRGVPSDFLRNRLMLSIDPAIRNWIGGRFVAARIRYEKWFEKFFPKRTGCFNGPAAGSISVDASSEELRRYWSEQLRRKAKDDVFNMFHNKSDDFLNNVAAGRLSIVGPPIDNSYSTFRAFDSDQHLRIDPDAIVPAVGFRSTLSEVTGGIARVPDFYLGCINTDYDNLSLVGFARPIIGNIPSISEMQARYVCGLLAGRWSRPANLSALHEAEARQRAHRFQNLNLDHVYPVEMIPYCDRLAAAMNALPSRSPKLWWSTQTGPATTLDYTCFTQEKPPARRTYLPILLIAVLLALKPVDWVYKLIVRRV